MEDRGIKGRIRLCRIAREGVWGEHASPREGGQADMGQDPLDVGAGGIRDDPDGPTVRVEKGGERKAVLVAKHVGVKAGRARGREKAMEGQVLVNRVVEGRDVVVGQVPRHF